MRYIKEALNELTEEEVSNLPARRLLPHQMAKRDEKNLPVDTDLNGRLMSKIEAISKALAAALEKEGIEVDAELVAQDMVRDCGLMGDIIDTKELDVEGNPFDAATKEMHDMGPINTQMACDLLLKVDPEDFARTFVRGIKSNRGMLPNRGGMALPHREEPRRLGGHHTPGRREYVESLISRLNENLMGYYKNNYKNKWETQKGLTPEEFIEMCKLDPTFKENSTEVVDKETHRRVKQDNSERGSYTDWLARLIVKNGVDYQEMMQNAHEYKDQLEVFNDLKKRNRLPADKKDIMQYKNLEELMEMIQGLSAQIGDSDSHSDFKQDIANIREGITKITGLADKFIPKEIQSWEDVFNFICENDKWEVWEAKNEFATMIFDRWGAGAGWCVGGMLGNNSGEEQYKQAKNYFPNYNAHGTATYVCFQQKDKTAKRPDNKYLITFGENGSLPNNGGSGYQFNNANNQTQYIGERGYGDDYQGEQMDALAKFLKDEGLFDVFKASKFGGCEAITSVENLERLEKGEPFIYYGGKIKKLYKDKISKIKFKYLDKEYEVDAKQNPKYLDVDSINEMFNLKEVIEEGKPYVYEDGIKIKEVFHGVVDKIIFTYKGVQHEVDAKKYPNFFKCDSAVEMLNLDLITKGGPYIYDGTIIKDVFQEDIRVIILPEDYNRVESKHIGGESREVVCIPSSAFSKVHNVTDIYVPAQVIAFGYGCFKDCNDVTIHTPKHKISCLANDTEFICQHTIWDDWKMDGVLSKLGFTKAQVFGEDNLKEESLHEELEPEESEEKPNEEVKVEEPSVEESENKGFSIEGEEMTITSTKIEPSMFEGEDVSTIKVIKLPEGVESISKGSFANFPEDVKVESKKQKFNVSSSDVEWLKSHISWED